MKHFFLGKYVKEADLAVPLGGNGFGKRKALELERPLGGGLEGPVIEHHRPPVPVIGHAGGDLFVEALSDDGPRHERHRHCHRRLVPGGRRRSRPLHVDSLVHLRLGSRIICVRRGGGGSKAAVGGGRGRRSPDGEQRVEGPQQSTQRGSHRRSVPGESLDDSDPGETRVSLSGVSVVVETDINGPDDDGQWNRTRIRSKQPN